METSDLIRHLDLESLRRGRPGLSTAYGSALAEAASVCFEEEGHPCGVSMDLDAPERWVFEVRWPTLSANAFSTWADGPFATEQGAYGIAIMVVEAVTGLEVKERSKKGTGFDYWLGPPESEARLFQDLTRLEVSGIRRAERSQVDSRVQTKIRQTERSDDLGISAYIVIVEFGRPLSVLRTR